MSNDRGRPQGRVDAGVRPVGLARRDLLRAGAGAALGAAVAVAGGAPVAVHADTGARRRLGFGQRVGQIVQFAYVVEDMHAAIDSWVANTGTGPWFLLESFTGPDQVYRGRPSMADVRIAMAFSGHVQIELIEAKDDHPSVYRDTIEAVGYGFHHIGVAVEDTAEAARAYEARGFTEAFSADVPSGGRVRYMDNGGSLHGFIELLPATEGMDEVFTAFWRAAEEWDGVSDPVRAF